MVLLHSVFEKWYKTTVEMDIEMKNFLKKTFISANVAAMSVFGGKALAQEQAAPENDENLIALNEGAPEASYSSSSKTAHFNENVDTATATEKTDDNAQLGVTREGGAGDAQSYSIQNDVIVVHMACGRNLTEIEKQKYISGVRSLFKNEKFTDQPADVAIFFQNDVIENRALFSVYDDGRDVVDIVTVRELAGKIDEITTNFYDRLKRESVVGIDPSFD